MAKIQMELGTIVKFEGVREYKEACQSISQNLSLIGSEMKILDAEYGKNSKSTKALTEKKKLMARQLEENKKKVSEGEQALKALTNKFGENSKEVQKFQTELNYSKARLKQTENSIDELSKSINKNKFHFESWGEAAKFAGQKIGNVLKNQIVNFGKGAAFFGAQTIAAGTGLTKFAVDASYMADNLLTQSSQTRLSTKELQEYSYALNFIDGDMDSLTGSMTKNIKNMDEAKNGNRNLAREYKKLGVNIKNSDGSLKDSKQVYWEVIDALGKVENKTQRDALAMKLLGKSATELNPIIEAGSEAFFKYGEEAESMGLIVGGESLAQLGEVNDTIMKLKASSGGLKNTLGLIALPFLKELSTGGLDILSKFNKSMADAKGNGGKMSEAFGNLFKDLGGFIGKNLPNFLKMGGQIASSIFNGLSANAGEITKTLGEMVSGIVGGIASHSKEIVSLVSTLIRSFISAIFENAPQILMALLEISLIVLQSLHENITKGFEKLFALLSPIFNSIGAWIQEKWEGFMAWIGNLIYGDTGIVAGWNNIKESVGNAIDTAITWLQEKWQGMLTWVGDLIYGDTGIVAGWDNIKENVGNAIDTAVKWLQDKWQGMLTWIGNLITGDTGIVAGWNNIKNSIGTAIDEAGTWINEKFTGILSAVSQLIFGDESNPSGIKKAFETIKNNIVGVFENAKTAISNVFTNLLETIKQPIQAAIDWIKGIFKLPKIDIKWKDSGVLGVSIPEFKVNWNAKGAIFNKPTVLQGVGEAGAEAVIPIRKLWEEMEVRFERSLNKANTNNNNIYITQNIYADSLDYYEMQKKAAREFEGVARYILNG